MMIQTEKQRNNSFLMGDKKTVKVNFNNLFLDLLYIMGYN